MNTHENLTTPLVITAGIAAGTAGATGHLGVGILIAVGTIIAIAALHLDPSRGAR